MGISALGRSYRQVPKIQGGTVAVTGRELGSTRASGTSTLAPLPWLPA